MSTPAKNIAVCTRGHPYSYATLPPERCPNCGRPWDEPLVKRIHDEQEAPKEREAA